MTIPSCKYRNLSFPGSKETLTTISSEIEHLLGRNPECPLQLSKFLPLGRNGAEECGANGWLSTFRFRVAESPPLRLDHIPCSTSISPNPQMSEIGNHVSEMLPIGSRQGSSRSGILTTYRAHPLPPRITLTSTCTKIYFSPIRRYIGHVRHTIVQSVTMLSLVWCKNKLAYLSGVDDGMHPPQGEWISSMSMIDKPTLLFFSRDYIARHNFPLRILCTRSSVFHEWPDIPRSVRSTACVHRDH
jgi:hypothetical protein